MLEKNLIKNFAFILVWYCINSKCFYSKSVNTYIVNVYTAISEIIYNKKTT